jgi:hypothetical protein
MIRFACPKCGATYQVDEDKARKPCTCPACQTLMRIPAPFAQVTADDTQEVERQRYSATYTYSAAFCACCFALAIVGLISGFFITIINWRANPLFNHYSNEKLLVEMNDRVVGSVIGVGWTICSLLILGFAVKIYHEK